MTREDEVRDWCDFLQVAPQELPDRMRELYREAQQVQGEFEHLRSACMRSPSWELQEQARFVSSGLSRIIIELGGQRRYLTRAVAQ